MDFERSGGRRLRTDPETPIGVRLIQPGWKVYFPLGEYFGHRKFSLCLTGVPRTFVPDTGIIVSR